MVSSHAAVHHMYMTQRVNPRFKKGVHRRTFIRQWREYRGKSLEAVAEAVGERIGGFTHASLSRIERGLQPYSQPILEALADILQTDEGSLLMRDPSDSEALWSIWEQAKPGERRMIMDIAKTVTKTGT